MEEVLQFVEASSVYVLLGVLLPELESSMVCTCVAVMHDCRLTNRSMDMDRQI